MVNAMIVTNMVGNLSQEEKEKYLQNIQKVAGRYNFRIVGAVIDHSEGKLPFFGEVLELISEVISTGQSDAIILDDTFDYEKAEAYVKLSELADSYHIAIFHYEDGDIYMPDEKEDFDYAEEPFEVFELTMTDESYESSFDSFSKGIEVICRDFNQRIAEMPPCKRYQEMHSFVSGMISVAEVLLEEAARIQKQMEAEIKGIKKKSKKK